MFYDNHLIKYYLKNDYGENVFIRNTLNTNIVKDNLST